MGINNYLNQKTSSLIDKDGNSNSSNFPISNDGEIVYAKDIWVEESDMGNFSGSITDLFDNLHTVITDATNNNPKEIIIHFNRSFVPYALGLGCHESGTFSNIEVQFGISGPQYFTVADFSDDDAKRQSQTFLFTEIAGANAIKLIFHTADEVCLSNIFVVLGNFRTVRIQAVSERTGDLENINSFKGALNITDALVHTNLINRKTVRELGVESLLIVAIISNTREATVTDGTLFSIGDEILIRDSGTLEDSALIIIDITGNVITVNRPFDNDYDIGDIMYTVSHDMNVIGTPANPISFKIEPPALGDFTRYQLARMLISMTHKSSPDDEKFGGITALTNGVIIRIFKDGKFSTAAVWHDNSDLKLDMYDVVYSEASPAGNYGTAGRWTVTNAKVIIDLDGTQGDYAEVLIQDDLTDLESFEIKVQGRVFGE